MSIDGSTNNVTAIETDMRDVLRARRPRLSDVSRETDKDYSSFVSGISSQPSPFGGLCARRGRHGCKGMEPSTRRRLENADMRLG